MDKKQVSKHSIIDQVNMDAIEGFCRQVYYCDPYTARHAEHVADLMAGLAAQMSMSTEEINMAYVVGLVHDIGKIKTPESILTKPDRLTEEEYQIMKRHSTEGAEMLADLEGTESIIVIMRHHHERFDGRGYPDGIKGEAIPLFSRMLAVCDSFDAMTTNRCYRDPVNLEECLLEIKNCAGGQFDPQLCDVFLEFIEERFGYTIEKLKYSF